MALSIVRILSFTASEISVLFSDELDENIGITNVSLLSCVESVEDGTILSVTIDKETLNITYRSIFPNIKYKFVFASTDSQNFQSAEEDQIVEDGNRNILFVATVSEEAKEIKETMFEGMSVIYESDELSVLDNIVGAFTTQIQKAQDVLDTTKSSNYISLLVEDEVKTRGAGPTDRLDNGGAFQVVRVSTNPTGSSTSGELSLTSTRVGLFTTDGDVIVSSAVGKLTEDPISLRFVDVISETVSDDIEEDNYFDGLFIRVAKGPIAQLVSLTLIQDEQRIQYDIEQFGYTILDNQYDTANASINVTFGTRDLELSSGSITGLSGGFAIPKAGDTMVVSYVYKNLGRNIDESSVVLGSTKQSVREEIQAILTSFSLDNAPVVLEDGSTPTSDGVSFLNTQADGNNPPFTVTHSAFSKEILFDENSLPGKPGEFCVDYTNGKVYVYGEDISNNGTGLSPPVATYYYKKIYIPDVDYEFDPDTDDLVIKSTSNLQDVEATIEFDYEDTLAEGQDFRSLAHVEALNERVNNKLIDDFKIETDHFPITNVFRIYNETTGEIYALDRFNDTSITFTGRQAPKTKDIVHERANFSYVSQETLLVSDELVNSSDLRVFKIELQNSKISDSQRKYIGASFNSSLVFSDTDLFVHEMFYDEELASVTLANNLDRLTSTGYYSVNYSDGIVYVAVEGDQDTDIGNVSYYYTNILVTNKHITQVSDIYRSANLLLSNLVEYPISSFSDTESEFTGLERVGERFIDDGLACSLLVGTYQSGSDGVLEKDSILFESNSAIFTEDDIGRTLSVGSSEDTPVEDFVITNIIGDHQLELNTSATQTGNGRVWAIYNTSSSANKIITLKYDIVSVNAIYLVDDIGTIPTDGLTNYFDSDRDSFEDNIITLGSDNPLFPGDAIVVDYNFGNLYIDYTYLQDELLVSYEYGNNSIDWSISSSLSEGDQYYVTYKYGALRDSLLLNFGSLTQVPELTNFSPTFDREVYRSVVQGTLQSFIEGPTVPAIKRIVESFTDVTPEITETVFDEWIVGRNHLHLRSADSSISYDVGKFYNGVFIETGKYLSVPAVSHFKTDEGTMECWVRPQWAGNSNDATITFDLSIDGYADINKVFIGPSGTQPEKNPFSVDPADTSSVYGIPNNIGDDVGFFIWFDENINKWQLRIQEHNSATHTFLAKITTTGKFYGVSSATGSDGYDLNEISDILTSTENEITFEAKIDEYDGYVDPDGYGVLDGYFENKQDGIVFSSSDIHYIFDLAYANEANRFSLYKDAEGFLNFRVYDNKYLLGNTAGIYNLSYDISDWEQNVAHHIATSWKFNSSDQQDEMHLFVDGEEVPNLFKYGVYPVADDRNVFGEVAQETLMASAAASTVGGYDGLTTKDSKLFRCSSINFRDAGVSVGQLLYILESTDDGNQSPYTITGVGEYELELNKIFVSSIGNVQFTINPLSFQTSVPVNFQDFIVLTNDGDSIVELNGLDSDEPDYTTSYGSSNEHIITIYNGIRIGYKIDIKTLGLIFKKVSENVYNYNEDSDEINLRTAPEPVSLGSVCVTQVIIPTTEIQDGYTFSLTDTLIDGINVASLKSTFVDLAQPSNTTKGRKLSIYLSGDNINYLVPENKITINGGTYDGDVSEIITFDRNTTHLTTQHWTRIDSIEATIIPSDSTSAAGVIKIKEHKPITISENNGNKAELYSFSNGLMTFTIYGSGGDPFYLRRCWYEVEYSSYLRVNFDCLPDSFYIGTDHNKENALDGTIDELRILDTMMSDLRIGESITDTTLKTITTDYETKKEFEDNTSTLLLMHFNNNLDDESSFRDKYDLGFRTIDGPNDDFETAIRLDREDSPFIIDNAMGVFNNNEGTVEFWVYTMLDSLEDPNLRYYIDMTSSVVEEYESSTSINVLLTRKARSIESVRLITDIYNTGTNYYSGGKLSSEDYKTITLGIPLPAQNTAVKVTYVPLTYNGDRVSIYKDKSGYINFYVKASGVEHVISVSTTWQRHSWHRIMAMWITNSSSGEDRLRLFVDGEERGTVKYGTGLLYGDGTVYGQEEVRAGYRFIVDNIDLEDTFSRIYVGTDVYNTKSAMAAADNLRFSDIQRLSSIVAVGDSVLDSNYTSNVSTAEPVGNDLYTTYLSNFNILTDEVKYLVTLVNAETGIFKFTVKVIDSYNKVIGNTQLENLLTSLINTLKPSHTIAEIQFLE